MAVPARLPVILSAKFGYTPLCIGAFVAKVSGTAVPARFSAITCTHRCVHECLMLRCLVWLCPLIYLPSSGTRRCVRERLC